GKQAMAANTNKITWPEHIVDASKLFAAIASELGANPNSPASHRIYDRAFTIEQYVEKARQDGKIKRYVYKHPDTGEPMAYGYHRDDLKRLIDQTSKLK
ncbi:MAG: hypothetical protein ACHQ7M_08985, partial [Chloroflexota bacterium]